MQNPELCKELLQRILPDLKIDCIKYPELQKSINVDIMPIVSDWMCMLKDDRETVYDIEITLVILKD